MSNGGRLGVQKHGRDRALKALKRLGVNLDGLVKRIVIVMPVPGQVRDDVTGIQNMPAFCDSGCQNSKPRANATSYEVIDYNPNLLGREK